MPPSHSLIVVAPILLVACAEMAPTAAPDATTENPTDNGAADAADGDDADAQCCVSDSDCEGGGLCLRGACQPRPAEGCLDDSGCSSGQRCVNATVCSCDDSPCEPVAGSCEVPGPCCGSDAECRGGRCIAGACLPALAAGRCYTDTDCPLGAACAAARTCPCGDTCALPTAPGWCRDLDALVCRDDTDCSASHAACVAGLACGPSLEPGQCYDDADCGAAATCDGAVVCPALDGGCGTPSPGTCRAQQLDCDETADCAPGSRCVVADAMVCPLDPTPPKGQCLPDVVEGCWATTECIDQRCVNATPCTAPDGCTEPHAAGACAEYVGIGATCDNHAECGPQGECRNGGSSLQTCPPDALTARCVPAPDGDYCANTLDCAAGKACVVQEVCPEDDLCMFDLTTMSCTCPTFTVGRCTPAAEVACTTDNQCSPGWTCARDEECYAKPCGNTNSCDTIGACRLPSAGQCWSHASCGDGAYCKGLRVCPKNVPCTAPDAPGVCSPREPAGVCCTSHLACGVGLRCVTAAANGCELNVSATCVPETVFNTTCFVDDDCLPSRICEGQTICPCGASDCVSSAGSCVIAPP